MKYSTADFTRLLNVVVPLSVLLLFTACSGGNAPSPDVNRAQIESDAELRSYLIDQLAKSVTPAALQDRLTDINAEAGLQAADPAIYSGTNLQEAGVDESDTIKTDGNYLFIADEDKVRIVSAVPPQSMRLVHTIVVDGPVHALYLNEGLLSVLYRVTDGEITPLNQEEPSIGIGLPYWMPAQEKTGILLMDVTEPASPHTIKEIHIDGYLVSSRLTRGKLHAVTQFIPMLPHIDIWYDGSQADKAATISSNRLTLDSLTLDDLIPEWTVFDACGTVLRQGRAVGTEDIVRPTTTTGGSLVTVISLDLESPTHDLNTIAFVGDVHHVYASTESLYLVSTLYHYPEGISEEDDDGVVSTQNALFETQIYKFNLITQPVSYSAEGRVSGELLNSFALGEYKQVLRVATTTGNSGDGDSENHVFCLKENGGELQVIGRLEGLAPGERLYSARFLGDRGFLVTFLQVDPLFTLDLSDPMNPTQVGELKVPGYSTYLHALDDDHLLAFGQRTSVQADTVVVDGLQLSLFDISDFANPKLLHSRIIGERGTYSEALHDHKALTVWPAKNLLAFPVNLYEFAEPPQTVWDYGDNTFNGIFVYQLTEEYDFRPLGQIELFDLENPIEGWYGDSWSRGVFIDDFIYAATSKQIKAAPVDTIGEPFITLNFGQ